MTDKTATVDTNSPTRAMTDPAQLTVWTDATLGTVGMTMVIVGENDQLPVDAIAVS